MNSTETPASSPHRARDFRNYLGLCEEVLALVMSENQCLAGPADYQSFSFHQKRKTLLPRLDESFLVLRNWRMTWQQLSPTERVTSSEVKTLFRSIESLLMRILVMDRENQQALLRRGLLPATRLPSAASQKPHFVATLYRRHSVPQIPNATPEPGGSATDKH